MIGIEGCFVSGAAIEKNVFTLPFPVYYFESSDEKLWTHYYLLSCSSPCVTLPNPDIVRLCATRIVQTFAICSIINNLNQCNDAYIHI